MIQPWNFTCLWHLWQKYCRQANHKASEAGRESLWEKSSQFPSHTAMAGSCGSEAGLAAAEQCSLATKLAPERAQTLHASIFTPIFPCLQSNRVIINSVADPWYLGISSILSLFSFHSEREACQNSNIFFLFFVVNTIVQNCPIEHRKNIISKRKKKSKRRGLISS